MLLGCPLLWWHWGGGKNVGAWWRWDTCNPGRMSSPVCQPCIQAEGGFSVAGGGSTDGGFLLGPADAQGTELLSAVSPPQSPTGSWSRWALPSRMATLWVEGVCEEGTRLRLRLLCGALGMTAPVPTGRDTSLPQGLLCLFCCRWEEVTPKTGCPATPACSTTMSHFHHSPAHSLTSTGSRTRTAVRQLCTRARLRLSCRGGVSGHPLGPALCSRSPGGDGCPCEAAASSQRPQGGFYLEPFPEVGPTCSCPSCQRWVHRAPRALLCWLGGWALTPEGLGGGRRTERGGRAEPATLQLLLLRSSDAG